MIKTDEKTNQSKCKCFYTFFMYLEKLEKESSNKNNATKIGKPSWYFRKT